MRNNINSMQFKEEPLIFEKGKKGRRGVSLPPLDIPEDAQNRLDIPSKLLREPIDGFPEVSEVEVIRHYTRLSQRNFGIDSNMYPLGSCTMKYNPKVNERISAFPGFSFIHPLQPEEQVQGALRLMFELERFLAEITGLHRVTLQPAAGAHGEYTGLRMIKEYFKTRNEVRTKILVPDTAHGTNPASASMCGFRVVEFKSGKDGTIKKDTIKSLMDETVAAIMLTNPNTLGLFETDIVEIAEIVHEKGGFVYCDGANLNALMGITRFGDLGVDVVHMNLHKTFSAPHGGGGPGSGPVAVCRRLADYLPVPVVERRGDFYYLNYNIPKTIGRVSSFYGNFLVCVKAYCYILTMGPDGLKRASINAVINANYLRRKIEKKYHLPYRKICMHECVFTDKNQRVFGANTLDIAKRLIDYGFHPPTIYFPLVVNGALMIEPTETEAKETLDEFMKAMMKIAEEAEKNPELLKNAPHHTPVRRVDEVKAARNPKLRWNPAGSDRRMSGI